MALGRKGTAIQKTLSMLLFGEQGCRKSSISAEAIALTKPDGKPMRVLFIDSEFGGLDEVLEMKSEQYDVDLENTYVIYTESYSEIMGILDMVKNNEDFYYYDEDGTIGDELVLDADGNPFRADFVVLDGTTVIYNASSIALTKFSEKRAKVKAKAQNKSAEETLVSVQGAGLELKDYNKLNKERSQELILKLISTGCHHIVTARETDEKKSVRTDDGKIQSVPTGRKIPDGFKGMQYNVGTVVRLYTDEFGDIKGYIENKDRTRTFEPNTIIDVPSLLMWQGVIDKNANRQRVNLNPTFANAIEKEFEKEMEENNLDTDVVDGSKELSVEQYQKVIEEVVNGLSPQQKKTLSPKLKEFGLTPNYKGYTEVDKLKKFLEVVSK